MTSLGGGRCIGGAGYAVKLLWTPSYNDIAIKIPREGSISIRQRLAGGGGKYLEGTEEVDLYLPDLGAAGRRCQDVGDVIQGGSSVSSPICIGDMYQKPAH